MEVFLLDGWLDDEYPWMEDEQYCGECDREFIVVYRTDKYPLCPYCAVTDRVRKIGRTGAPHDFT